VELHLEGGKEFVVLFWSFFGTVSLLTLLSKQFGDFQFSFCLHIIRNRISKVTPNILLKKVFPLDQKMWRPREKWNNISTNRVEIVCQFVDYFARINWLYPLVRRPGTNWCPFCSLYFHCLNFVSWKLQCMLLNSKFYCYSRLHLINYKLGMFGPDHLNGDVFHIFILK